MSGSSYRKIGLPSKRSIIKSRYGGVDIQKRICMGEVDVTDCNVYLYNGYTRNNVTVEELVIIDNQT
jgi:hypothetical protein